MRICVNCAYCKFPELSTPQCMHPNNLEREVDVVTGRVYEAPNVWSCKSYRGGTWLYSRLFGLCGKEGRWFEERCD